MLSRAAAQLTNLPAVEAKLRQKTQMFGQEVTGSGTYLQSQSQRGLLLRLELKLQVGGQQSSLQQVCDGRFLWIRRDVASGASLGRVDMDRIREAIRTSARPTWADASTSLLAVGGLPQLLAALADHFQFSTPQAVRLDKAAVWVVDGRWKPDKLAELLPDQRERIAAGQPADLTQLSPQLPTDVRVVLGQNDLLPYRIEFRRTESGRNASARGGETPPPMVLLEILEIRRPEALDEGLFSYQPGNQEVADYTDLYLQALKLSRISRMMDAIAALSSSAADGRLGKGRYQRRRPRPDLSRAASETPDGAGLAIPRPCPPHEPKSPQAGLRKTVESARHPGPRHVFARAPRGKRAVDLREESYVG